MTEANVSGSQPELEPAIPASPEAVEQKPEVKPTTDQSDPNVTANGERLDRQTRNWRALERDRDYWREFAMRTQAPPPAPAAPETAKTLADFQYDEGKYQAYLFQTAEQRAVSAAERKIREQQQQDAQQRRASSFKSREVKFSESNKDYFEVTRSEDLSISGPMAEAIAESDDGPALAYHLGKNPDVAARIAELSPLAAARELGRIEARLASEKESAKGSVVSKAPPPPAKIEGVDPALSVKTTDASGDKLSDDEWVKAERARLRRKEKRQA